MNALRKQGLVYAFSITASILSCLCLIPTGCSLTSGQPATPSQAAPLAHASAIHADPPGKQPGVLSARGNIAHLSDIHFDPFYDPSLLAALIDKPAGEWEAVFEASHIKGYGSAGKDANYNLMKSAFADMAARTDQGRTLDFIIFTGDFLSHDFNKTFKRLAPPKADADAFVKKDVEFMVHLFNKYFPDTPVYIALGNNDDYLGDYRIQAGGKFLKDSASMLSGKLIKVKDQDLDSFIETYATGGYYAINQASSNTRIIALNSTFFSNSPARPSDDDAPALKELDWLAGQLQQASRNNQKVWLITHIPPGDNTYSTLSKHTYDGQWKAAYTERLIELMKMYTQTIMAGFGGHTHVDDFRILTDGATSANSLGFFRIGPAVSPIFYNNPAYQLMSYDRQSFTLKDYSVFYLNLAQPNPTGWEQEYSFTEAYGQQAITAASLLKVFNEFKEPGTQQDDYMLHYNTGYALKPVVTKANLTAYLCTIVYWLPMEYNQCLATMP